MREYLYNKDFLPESYIRNKNKEISNVNRRDRILLALIAFALVPLSVANIKSNFKESEQVINEEIVEEGLDDKFIYNWLNIMDKCSEGSFTNNEGNIYVYGKEDLEDILKNENIAINTMEDLGENKYRLHITQKEIN